LLDEGETLLLQSFPEDDEIPPTITIVSTADVARQIKLDVPKDHARDLEYHRRMEWRLRPLVFGKVLWLQDKFGLSRWDPKTGKLLDQLNPGFLDLAASADGKRIAASRGRRLYVGTTDGNLDALLKSNDFWDFPRRIAFQPDGTLMAWSETHQYPGGRVAVYDPRKGSQISSHVTPVRDRSGPRCMDPSLKVMAKYDKEGIAIIDLANSKQISRLQVDKKSPRGFNAIQVSADGKRVLTWESVRENPYRFRWFDVATGRELGRMDVPYREVFPAYGG
jgi:hypothetical protein